MIPWEEYNKKNCCVVIPVYTETLTEFEEASLKQCMSILGKKRDIYIAAPLGLKLDNYFVVAGDILKEKRFAPGFFKNIDGYNELCKRWEFYDTFREYECLLIYQLDCWVFRDDLDYFAGLGYDFIGAPWFVKKGDEFFLDECGNGGFSLRKVKSLLDVCKTHEAEADNSSVPEDVFFCKNCKGELKICPLEIGWQFSFEVGPQILFRLNNNNLPMGCHKPWLFAYKTFWQKYISF